MKEKKIFFNIKFEFLILKKFVINAYIEIQHKIEALKNDKNYSLPVYNSDLNRILQELKDQQRINEAALNMLRQRIFDEPPLIAHSPYTMRRNNPYLSSSFPSLYNPEMIMARPWDTSFTADEIRIMRLNYLQGGGHDQSILNRFTEMEYDARFRDPATRGLGYRPIGKYFFSISLNLTLSLFVVVHFNTL